MTRRQPIGTLEFKGFCPTTFHLPAEPTRRGYKANFKYVDDSGARRTETLEVPESGTVVISRPAKRLLEVMLTWEP
jgi:hypothetical protein